MSKTISLHNTDKELVEAIKNNQSWAIEKLYTLDRTGIFNFVMNNNGDYDDAQDALQEGVIAVHRNIISNKYKLEDRAQLKTYLNQVCRFWWYNKLRERGKISRIPEEYDLPAEPSNSYQEKDEQLEKLKIYFSQLSEKCQVVLRLRFEEKKKMEEIAVLLGNTPQVIRNRSSQCIKELYGKFNNTRS
jgi:RNA polymerase sigma factor (sigma-70 family)